MRIALEANGPYKSIGRNLGRWLVFRFDPLPSPGQKLDSCEEESITMTLQLPTTHKSNLPMFAFAKKDDKSRSQVKIKLGKADNYDDSCD